jgi:hypothetical protein
VKLTDRKVYIPVADPHPRVSDIRWKLVLLRADADMPSVVAFSPKKLYRNVRYVGTHIFATNIKVIREHLS